MEGLQAKPGRGDTTRSARAQTVFKAGWRAERRAGSDNIVTYSTLHTVQEFKSLC